LKFLDFENQTKLKINNSKKEIAIHILCGNPNMLPVTVESAHSRATIKLGSCALIINVPVYYISRAKLPWTWTYLAAGRCRGCLQLVPHPRLVLQW